MEELSNRNIFQNMKGGSPSLKKNRMKNSRETRVEGSEAAFNKSIAVFFKKIKSTFSAKNPKLFSDKEVLPNEVNASCSEKSTE